MNKTLTVNIAGLVFHIDENAYNKLHQYLEAIKRSITTEEREEIIHDIEIRIAELFSAKINDFNQVIIEEDVEEVIQIMGKPEDYNIDGETESNSENETYYTFPKVKKLYRDKENSLLGGVLAGFGHYFKIDVVWLRVLFLLLLLLYGTGVVFYIILWIVIPAAKTTSQILEMRGEPINISSIEKKVKENIDYVTQKVQNIDYQKISKTTRDTTNQGLEIIKRAIGILLIIMALVGFLSSALATIFFLKNASILGSEVSEFLINTSYPTWLSITLTLACTLIPFIIFFLIGLKLLYSNIKYIGVFSITLAILWIISSFTLALPYAEMNKVKKLQIKYTSKERQYQKNIDFDLPKDTLQLKIVDDAFFAQDNLDPTTFEGDYLSSQLDLEIKFLKSYQDKAYATLKTKFEEDDIHLRVKLDEPLEIPTYNFKTVGNTLFLSNTFTFKNGDTDEKSEAKLQLYLPEQYIVFIEDKLQSIIDDQKKLSVGDHYYQLVNQELQCTDCN